MVNVCFNAHYHGGHFRSYAVDIVLGAASPPLRVQHEHSKKCYLFTTGFYVKTIIYHWNEPVSVTSFTLSIYPQNTIILQERKKPTTIITEL